MLRVVVWLLGSLVATGGVADETIQDLDAIAESARTFLQQRIASDGVSAPQVSINRLDNRLRLTPCSAPLEAFLPQSNGRLQGRVTVGVRCVEPKPWTLYVQAQLQLLAPVVVSRRPLNRGTQIAVDDLIVREQDIAQLNSGYFSAVDELIGMELTRSLQGGMVLNPAMLQRPRLIARGDRVSIEVRSSQLQVRMAGQALADGAAGERIQVRNLSSKRVVEGEVVAPGVVHVGTPTTD